MDKKLTEGMSLAETCFRLTIESSLVGRENDVTKGKYLLLELLHVAGSQSARTRVHRQAQFAFGPPWTSSFGKASALNVDLSFSPPRTKLKF